MRPAVGPVLQHNIAYRSDNSTRNCVNISMGSSSIFVECVSEILVVHLPGQISLLC